MQKIINFSRIIEILQRRLINDYSQLEIIQPKLNSIIKSLNLELQASQISSDSILSLFEELNLSNQLSNAIIYIQQKLSTQFVLQKNVLIFKLSELQDFISKDSIGVFDIEKFIFEVKECTISIMGENWWGIQAIVKQDKEQIFKAIIELSE